MLNTAALSCMQGGLYHGRILLPPEYPFKPPSFLLLTPNGRFETGQKVRGAKPHKSLRYTYTAWAERLVGTSHLYRSCMVRW